MIRTHFLQAPRRSIVPVVEQKSGRLLKLSGPAAGHLVRRPPQKRRRRKTLNPHPVPFPETSTLAVHATPSEKKLPASSPPPRSSCEEPPPPRRRSSSSTRGNAPPTPPARRRGPRDRQLCYFSRRSSSLGPRSFRRPCARGGQSSARCPSPSSSSSPSLSALRRCRRRRRRS